MHNKKAAIFDLDGTLLDTIKDLASSVNRALAMRSLPPHSVGEVRSFIGNGALMLVSRASGYSPESPECAALRADFTADYKNHLADDTLPYPGIPELVKTLADSGVKAAVVSNKDDSCVQILIKKFFGENVTVSRGVRAESERKPSPETTFEVLSVLGITPEEAVFIGDGKSDHDTAHNAGITFVPVSYGYTDPAKFPAFCAETPCPDVPSLTAKLKEIFGI
ncbi:MAG: HAD hydrolase-like protein [Clostridia bacterium]|nr:HAD hydrolase-like protein [Clostridia bacterium]